jgi:predicted ATPase
MIRKLGVRNYKSLENVTLELQPLTVFVGCNNAGKSNTFDCLQFLADLVREGPNASTKRGGFQQIVFNGDISRPISVELEGEVYLGSHQERDYKYSIEATGDRWGNCNIVKESLLLKIQEDEWKRLLEFPSENGMAQAWDETGKQIGGVGAGRNQSYLRHFSDPDLYPVVGRLSREVQSWALYDLLPPLMQASLPVKRAPRLEEYGQNLAMVLHLLQAEYPANFKEVEGILKHVIQEVETLTTGLTEDGKTYLRMKEKSLSISIPGWAMSNGTLRLLGYLAVAYSPSPPSLICLEEPENYVHPGLLEMVANLLKKASERTQTLVATHSPYLLNFLEPENLVIVERYEGKTQVKRAETEKGLKAALQTLGLGEMWYAGSLGGTP